MPVLFAAISTSLASFAEGASVAVSVYLMIHGIKIPFGDK